jgi:hypothetical protein
MEKKLILDTMKLNEERKNLNLINIYMNNIIGYFNMLNLLDFSFFKELLNDGKVEGNILELGVYHGRSLYALSKIYKDDFIYGVDVVDYTNNFFNNTNVTMIISKTTKVYDRLKDKKFKFIHIDAGHNKNDIMNDLSTSAKLLSDGGIISCDDFFNPMYEQVSEGIFEFLFLNKNFCILFLNDNKCYICEKKYLIEYYKFFIENYSIYNRNLGLYIALQKNNDIADSSALATRIFNNNEDYLKSTYKGFYIEDWMIMNNKKFYKKFLVFFKKGFLHRNYYYK